MKVLLSLLTLSSTHLASALTLRAPPKLANTHDEAQQFAPTLHTDTQRPIGLDTLPHGTKGLFRLPLTVSSLSHTLTNMSAQQYRLADRTVHGRATSAMSLGTSPRSPWASHRNAFEFCWTSQLPTPSSHLSTASHVRGEVMISSGTTRVDHHLSTLVGLGLTLIMASSTPPAMSRRILSSWAVSTFTDNSS